MDDRTQQLIDQQLAGTISETDRDELLEQTMDNPEIAEALRAGEQAMYEGLRNAIVIDAPPRRKFGWLSHAATLLVGVGLATLVGQMQTPSTALVSANVHELDNVRSATPQARPVTIDPNEELVTFMTYPDIADYDALDVSIEAYSGEIAQAFAINDSHWTALWSDRSTPGNRDFLVVTLPSQLFEPGLYRILVRGVVVEPPASEAIHQVVFDLQYTH